MLQFMKLHCLPSLLFINIMGERHCGREAIRRRGRGGGKERRSSACWCGRNSWLAWLFGIDCFDSWFLLFFPPLINFRTMTDNCWTSNWWVNTSSDLVALTTKVAKMLRQSNKTDYFLYNLWVVDPGFLSLIVHMNTEAVLTDASRPRD